jgi:hypothetical protein
MYSFRRLAILLALSLPAMHAVQAQSSSSNPATPGQGQDQGQGQAQQPAATAQTQPQVSVQARIKARREQRRAAAIHDAYAHLYEAYVGAGFIRTHAGVPQKVNEYNWNVGFTRYFDERLGVTIDGRGYYGTPFVGLNSASDSEITKPAISTYSAMLGPTYRFYLQPKYSISGRVMAGFAHGNFSGDTNGIGSVLLGLYPDGSTYAASASIMGEYNVTPNISLRLAPEYFLTGFGSTQQNGLGFTAGLVYRIGKQ